MRTKQTVIMMITFLLITVTAFAQQDKSEKINQIKWQTGPSVGSLGAIAEIQIPLGYLFADANDTSLLMEITHNPPSGRELGFVAPDSLEWFLVFEFNDIGYVKDDEKNSLDAEAMMKALKEGTEAANKERVKQGWAVLNITGWEETPRYNPNSHNLEWALRAESEGSPVVNWNTRLLGRKGVMSVILVCEPMKLRETLSYFQTLVNGFSYKQGHKYAEFRQGDNIAKYGLSALIVGGAAAAAAKTGILKHLWKIVVVAFLAAAGFLKKLFSRNKG